MTQAVLPLRRVLIWVNNGEHILECRHRRLFRYTAYGPTYPRRARCHGCGLGEPPAISVEELTARLEALRRTRHEQAGR